MQNSDGQGSGGALPGNGEMLSAACIHEIMTKQVISVSSNMDEAVAARLIGRKRVYRLRLRSREGPRDSKAE